MYVSGEMGFLGGAARGAENSKTDSRAYGFPGGLKTETRGHKGRSETPPGRPRGPGDIDKMGSCKLSVSKCMLFLRKYIVFKERQRALGGVSRARFS